MAKKKAEKPTAETVLAEARDSLHAKGYTNGAAHAVEEGRATYIRTTQAALFCSFAPLIPK